MIINLLTSEVYSLIILAILLMACAFERKYQEKRVDAIAVLILGVFLTVLFDFISYIMEFHTTNITILTFFNILSYVAFGFIFFSFSYFYFEVLSLSTTIPKYYKTIAYSFSGIATFVTLILGCLGYLFHYENGVFIEGKFAPIDSFFSLFFMGAYLLITITNKKHFSKGEYFGILSFISLPTITSILIAAFEKNSSYSYIAATISALLSFVLSQNSIFYNNQVKTKFLNELSLLDPLTQIGNRRAFENLISSISDTEHYCIVFADLNGLKIVNDREGHLNGDNLLKEFVTISKKFFDMESLYRVSGDEFVYVVPFEDRDSMEKNIVNFILEVKNNNEIASIGYSFDSYSGILHMIHEAEHKMYAAKEAYHKKMNYHRY